MHMTENLSLLLSLHICPPLLYLDTCPYSLSVPHVHTRVHHLALFFQALDVLPDYSGKLYRAIDAEGVKKYKVSCV